MSAEGTPGIVTAYAPLDGALAVLSGHGPDLASGLTNHGPMAVESLCALGRPDAVAPWLGRYRQGMTPRPAMGARIDARRWRDALGYAGRFADWAALFRDEIERRSWRETLRRWADALSPGLSGAATHGVIRVGHAVRSLELGESPERLCELADALAYLAATYAELPTAAAGSGGTLAPGAAIERVAVLPVERRRFTGMITSALDALGGFAAFPGVIGLVGVEGDASRFLSDLTRTFAQVYLANARDVLTTIVFIHAVTSACAVRTIVPHLDAPAARRALRFAWQAGCALYVAFGTQPRPATEIPAPREAPGTLVELAVSHGDEHAIKFTEACLREYALEPSPAYLAAARHAIDHLPAAALHGS